MIHPFPSARRRHRRGQMADAMSEIRQGGSPSPPFLPKRASLLCCCSFTHSQPSSLPPVFLFLLDSPPSSFRIQCQNFVTPSPCPPLSFSSCAKGLLPSLEEWKKKRERERITTLGLSSLPPSGFVRPAFVFDSNAAEMTRFSQKKEGEKRWERGEEGRREGGGGEPPVIYVHGEWRARNATSRRKRIEGGGGGGRGGGRGGGGGGRGGEGGKWEEERRKEKS